MQTKLIKMGLISTILTVSITSSFASEYTSETAPTAAWSPSAAWSMKLSDSQLVDAINAVSQAEIDVAKFVLTKTKSDLVIALANQTLQLNTAATSEFSSTSTRTGLVAETSSLGKMIRSNEVATILLYSSLKEKGLNRAYINGQIITQLLVLDFIDKHSSKIKNLEIKSYLSKLRPQILEHLQIALKAKSLISDSHDLE